MKTLELEIVQGFFFYPHYAFRYIFVKLDFANSVAKEAPQVYADVCTSERGA